MLTSSIQHDVVVTPRTTRSWIWALTTVLVVIPCVWQKHIAGADYPSHLYNAWLAQTIAATPTEGLKVVPMWTNVLGDLVLLWASQSLGSAVAEMLVPALAVLLFFWGAFFWIKNAAGHEPWAFTPLLAMAAYGVVFHLGFLNHYLSTGICLWVLALMWRPTILRFGLALVLAALATLAHPLPVLWTAVLLCYVNLARAIPRQFREWLFIAALAAMIGLRQAIVSQFPSRPVWHVEDVSGIFLGMLGTEQVWVFGQKYFAVAIVLSAMAGALLWQFIDAAQRRHVSLWEDELLDLWILHAAAFVLIPAALQLPQYQHVLAFLPQRISLFGILSLCLLMASRTPAKLAWALFLPLALVYFSFLYIDSAAYNRVELQVDSLIEKLPPGQRVVGPIYDDGARFPALLHVVDRACIGRCFSFADYEPATGQFRIRAEGPNGMVAWRMSDVQAMEGGEYVVKAADEPFYSLRACEAVGGLCLQQVKAGEKTSSTTLAITPKWWQSEVSRAINAAETK